MNVCFPRENLSERGTEKGSSISLPESKYNTEQGKSVSLL